MTPEDFDLLAKLIAQRTGIALTPDKAYLLESRLLPVARKLNFTNLSELTASIRRYHDEKVLIKITDAMTTNESFFFRDQHPFDQFRKVLLPYFLKTRAPTKKLRIWSAAASSGQEAYSLAMICVDESLKLQGWTVDILGTDVSSEIVARAREGIYSQFEVQRGLPITMQLKHFTKIDQNQWQINENIRKMVHFQEGNLIKNFGSIGTFDVVFCRNVLIYFDGPTKSKVFQALNGVMASDAALMLGGAENTLGLTDCFKPVAEHRGLYTNNKAAEPFKLTA